MTKMNDVTNTDIDLLIQSGHDMTSYAMNFTHRISNGHCERFEEPSQKAKALITVSRSLLDLAARLLAQDSTNEKADKASQ